MQRSRHIAIILADTLHSTGLHSLLVDYFSPTIVSYFPTFASFIHSGNDNFEYYFTDAETYLLNADFFLPRKMKSCVLIEKEELINTTLTPYYISVKAPQEIIIEQMQQIFASEQNNPSLDESSKELSSRETDVLQLIVKGNTNKEIADKLNISLNTVLSHRKNITAKLGIKTVSGLTFYAIMNGVISADDIEL